MSSSARDILMANKLKDGVQDALVYLRLLEGAKLAPVYERKRVQLMSKLLDLQGDTRKEAPPKLDDDDDDDDEEDFISEVGSPPHRGGTGGRRTASTGGGDDTGGEEDGAPKRPERRNSKLNDIKSRFDQQASKGTYRYKTLEELKRESAQKKAGIKPQESTEEKPAEDTVSLTPSEEVTSPTTTTKVPVEKPGVDETQADGAQVEELKEEDEDFDAPKETHEAADQGETSQESNRKKSRSHTLGGGFIGKLFKGGGNKGKERSLTIPEQSGSTDNISQLSAENSSTALDEEPATEEDSGGKLSSMMERVTKRLGKYNYQKVTATLNEDSFHFMRPKDKEGTTLSLVGSAVGIRDSYSFELHTVEKTYTFRVETEDMCVKWVDALKAAIDLCTPDEQPIEEEIPEEIEEESPSVPQITVDTTDSASPFHNEGGDIKESTSYENFAFAGNKKKKQEMPDPTCIQIKSYLYKKGTFGWDKVWVVLTYDNAVFMSTGENSKKVLLVIPVGPETKIEKKKGDKKYPHALTVSSGKIKETLATDVQNDFTVWLSYLNQAAGANDIQELLSEDEDAGGELYEELELQEPSAPVIPASPRPAHAPFASPAHVMSGPEEEIYDDFDGDIYEGLDDIELPPPKSSQLPPPALPSRNEPKAAAPSLPPRNQPQEPPPSLPPRQKPVAVAMDYEAPLPSPSQKLPPQAPIDEELYDDVVGVQGAGQDLEETYDDVVSTQAAVSKLANQVSSGDLYEDMVTTTTGESLPVEEEGEEYCDMLLPGTREENPDELYVDVDEPPPRPPPPTASSNIPSRPPPPATGKSAAPLHTPPGKSVTPTSKGLLTKQQSDNSAQKTKSETAEETKSSTLPSAGTRSSPVVKRPPPPAGVANKRMSTGAGKVAHLSKMFGDAPTQQSTSPKNKRGTHSGTIQYKGPGKTSYSNDWCILEGSTLIFYKGPNEKLSHYRISAKEAELHLDAKGPAHSFYIKKGTVTHHFSANSLQEMSEWVGPIAHIVGKVVPAPDSLYQAKTDYEGKEEGELSFKKGEIVWVLGEATPTLWTGIVGSSISEFSGANGSFPSDKVGPLASTEDVYI